MHKFSYAYQYIETKKSQHKDTACVIFTAWPQLQFTSEYMFQASSQVLGEYSHRLKELLAG